MPGGTKGGDGSRTSPWPASGATEGRFLAGDRFASFGDGHDRPLGRRHRGQERKIVITDGPYADTKEQLGASTSSRPTTSTRPLADAAAIPSIGRTIIEVRPLWT